MKRKHQKSRRKGQPVLPKIFIILISLSLGTGIPLFGNSILSTIYQVQGKYAQDPEKAIALYQQAVKFDPDSASAYYNLGELLSNSGRLDQAIKAYQKAVELDPSLAKAFSGQGKALKNQGKYADAVIAYQQAWKITPNAERESKYADIFNDLGEALTAEGKLLEAVNSYNQAIEINPYYASAYNNLGVTLSQLGNLDGAIINYRKVIRLDPYNGKAYNNLGKALHKQGKLNEAIAAYEKAIVYTHNSGEIHHNLGKALLEKEEYYRAAIAYRDAIRLNPNSADAYSGLGEAQYKQGNLYEAIISSEKALELDPQNANAYKNICFVFHNQRKYDQAVKNCQKAFALDPSLREVKFYLAEVPRQLAFKRYPHIFNYPENLPNEPLFDLKRSVVKVVLKSEDGWGVGTGWIIKRKGNKAWVVTNRHVVTKKEDTEQHENIEVEFYSDPPPGQFRKRQPAKIVKMTSPNDWLDLAVLEVTGIPEDIQPLTLSSSSQAGNTPILVIGHPYNKTEWFVSQGDVSRKTHQKLELSAFLASGSSGGPVLNKQNQVVGLAVGIKLWCHTAPEIPKDMSCGVAYPIEVVTEKLKVWDIL